MSRQTAMGLIACALLAIGSIGWGEAVKMRGRAEKAEAALASHVCGSIKYLRLRIENKSAGALVDSIEYTIVAADTTEWIPLGGAK